MTGRFNVKLSPHFHLQEFLVSETASRKGIDNTPPADVVRNLYLVAHTLEIARVLCGDRVIIITSGYRSPPLNAAVGSARTSKHISGLAADWIIPGMSIDEIINRIRHRLGFDQLINEYGSWVHLGLSTVAYRQQTFMIGDE